MENDLKTRFHYKVSLWFFEENDLFNFFHYWSSLVLEELVLAVETWCCVVDIYSMNCCFRIIETKEAFVCERCIDILWFLNQFNFFTKLYSSVNSCTSSSNIQWIVSKLIKAFKSILLLFLIPLHYHHIWSSCGQVFDFDNVWSCWLLLAFKFP